MQVFVSYAKEDISIAERLYRYLNSLPGVIPWMDIKNLRPGEEWEIVISEAMKRSRLIFLLLSKHSVNKDGFVQEEIRNALDLYRRKPPNSIFIIPVRIECCIPRFPEIKKLHWVDLFEDFDLGAKKICEVIKDLQNTDFRGLTYLVLKEDFPSDETDKRLFSKKSFDLLLNELRRYGRDINIKRHTIKGLAKRIGLINVFDNKEEELFIKYVTDNYDRNCTLKSTDGKIIESVCFLR